MLIMIKNHMGLDPHWMKETNKKMSRSICLFILCSILVISTTLYQTCSPYRTYINEIVESNITINNTPLYVMGYIIQLFCGRLEPFKGCYDEIKVPIIGKVGMFCWE